MSGINPALEGLIFPEFHSCLIGVMGQPALISPTANSKISKKVLVSDDGLNVHSKAFPV